MRLLRVFLAALALLAVTTLAHAAAAADAPRPPNVILILADDLGVNDLACYGSTFYETPRLDRMAAEGMRFTNAYAAASICSPTRASILTGKSPARLHLTDWLPGRRDMPSQKLRRPVIQPQLALAEVTLAEALKAAGYATGHIGKWHLGGPAYYPEHQGFDVNLGGCDKGTPPSYFSPYKLPNLPDGPEGEYLTDRLADEAARFIAAHKDRPFFLYLPHYAVHNPTVAKPDLVEHFKAKLTKSGAQLEPQFRPEGDRQDRRSQGDPTYAAMVKSLDDAVGRVLDAVASNGLDDRTLVIFTSDNGGLSTSEGTPTSNAPLRAGKGWLYEGGIREPWLVRWPGTVKPAATCDVPVVSTDLFATIVDVSGVKAPVPPDGLSLAPLLRQAGDLPPRALYWHYPHYSNQGGRPGGAVRDGPWKLVEHYEDNRAELYNLGDDPGESKDRAADQPERTAALRAKLADWRRAVNAQPNTPNPDHDPDAKPPGGRKRAAPR